jgi:hypothetical protein
MNALTLLANDHKTVKKLFDEFEELGERAYKTKQEGWKSIILSRQHWQN